MRMMLVGAGAVGECILKVLKKRDGKGEWLPYVLITDYDGKRAEEVRTHLAADGECRISFACAQADAHDKGRLISLMREHEIDFVMDAASPFVSNYIFDAAYEAGADYASMGTWSVPKDRPAFGVGFEGSYLEPMTKYNFDRHEAWRAKGQMACICLGIDPGVVNVFAKYAAEYLFDELLEVHVKDGGNLTPPGKREKRHSLWLQSLDGPGRGDESQCGVGSGKGLSDRGRLRGRGEIPDAGALWGKPLVKVEHEEVVTLPRYLERYGLRKASFKIALDEKSFERSESNRQTGLRSLHPIEVDGVQVIPRDVVAACAPKPQDIGGDSDRRHVRGRGLHRYQRRAAEGIFYLSAL